MSIAIALINDLIYIYLWFQNQSKIYMYAYKIRSFILCVICFYYLFIYLFDIQKLFFFIYLSIHIGLLFSIPKNKQIFFKINILIDNCND